MSKKIELLVIQDGDELDPKKYDFIDSPKQFVGKWGEDYFNHQKKKHTVNFVGLILNKDQALWSFPKHYPFKDLEDDERIKEMKGLLTLIARGDSFSSNEQEENHFPMAAYLVVQDYYRKYGLHFVSFKDYKKGYSGRIDWRRTMRQSDKIIQDNGLVFLPFVTVRIKNVGEFLADCMELVLTETYQSFAPYLDFLTPYKRLPKNPIFSNPKRCIKELKGLKSKFFKDAEKQLIDALISYFEWKAKSSNKKVLATTNFAGYWEALVELYLEKGFVGIEENQLIWDGENGGQIQFQAQESQDIEDKEIKSRGGHKIRFDHFAIDGQTIYLFDSKYYKLVTDFDYKQAFYYYYLKQYYGDEYTIHNGLIAPTEEDASSEIMVNRSDGSLRYKDGLTIYVYKLKLKDLIDFAQDHLADFKTIYLKLDKSEND